MEPKTYIGPAGEESLSVTYVGPHDQVLVPVLGIVVAHGETIELAGAENVEIGRGLLLQGATAALDENGRHRTDEAGNDLYEPTHAVWAPSPTRALPGSKRAPSRAELESS